MVGEGVKPLVARMVWRLEYSPGAPGACVRAFHRLLDQDKKQEWSGPPPAKPHDLPKQWHQLGTRCSTHEPVDDIRIEPYHVMRKKWHRLFLP